MLRWQTERKRLFDPRKGQNNGQSDGEHNPDPQAHVTTIEILDDIHEGQAAIRIYGHCGTTDLRSLDAVDLYPDYQFTTADDALSDLGFVFINL